MNKDKDYYKILGISTKADKKEIKSAYRSLARKFHPDVNPGNKLYENKFKEIGEAYYILIDDQRRFQYDMLKGFNKHNVNSKEQTQKQAKEAYKTSGQSKSTDKPKQQEKKETTKNKKPFSDVFTEVMGKFFEKEQELKKNNANTAKENKQEYKKPDHQKGEDITTEISITIIEAHNGTVRKVNILRTDLCSRCKGQKTIGNIKCSNCDGKGEISSHKKLSVKIPPGVKEGSKIRIAGEGNKGLNGGENGDLYLLVNILKNTAFTFEGLNVLCEIPITPTEAALGAEILVPTIDGQVTMKIPPETNSGQKFKLSTQGIPDPNSSKRGDQLVTVKIEIPPNLTAKEKQLYQELAQVRRYNPRESIIFEKQ